MLCVYTYVCFAATFCGRVQRCIVQYQAVQAPCSGLDRVLEGPALPVLPHMVAGEGEMIARFDTHTKGSVIRVCTRTCSDARLRWLFVLSHRLRYCI